MGHAGHQTLQTFHRDIGPLINRARRSSWRLSGGWSMLLIARPQMLYGVAVRGLCRLVHFSDDLLLQKIISKVVTWIWSVCKCVGLILWGFRHFAICFCYDWIAKGDGKMGAPSRRESNVYIYLCIYIYVYACMCAFGDVCICSNAYMYMRACIYI